MRFRKLRIAWSVVWALAYIFLPGLNPGYDFEGPRTYFITPRQQALLAVPALLLIAAPWMPNKFSLRTVLAVTTFVAFVVGVIAWAAK